MRDGLHSCNAVKPPVAEAMPQCKAALSEQRLDSEHQLPVVVVSESAMCTSCCLQSICVLKFQVNNVDFANIIREEAVLFLLDLPKGEEVTILAQKKKDGE